MHFPDAFSRQRNGKSAGKSQPNGGQGVAEDGDWSEWWRTAYSSAVRRVGGGGVHTEARGWERELPDR
jgi:hypothetical protein